MQPQHTAVMVEPVEAASSSSAGTLHSRPSRLPAGVSRCSGSCFGVVAVGGKRGCHSKEKDLAACVGPDVEMTLH